jgi:hypothetical protein
MVLLAIQMIHLKGYTVKMGKRRESEMLSAPKKREERERESNH